MGKKQEVYAGDGTAERVAALAGLTVKVFTCLAAARGNKLEWGTCEKHAKVDG